MLDTLITSKTRLRLLVKFFINVANEGYLRGLATEMNESTNAIRKELNNLSGAGYLIRNEDSAKVTYRANQKHPLFGLLQQMVRKYVGIDSIVEHVLAKMGGVQRVFLIGDYAEGIDSGIIEIMLEGFDFNQQYLDQLVPKIQSEIGKRVDFFTTNAFEGKGLLVFENRES